MLKMMHSNKHNKKEKHECTILVSTKLCIFILALDKNSIDCIIIEIPLKEISAEHKHAESLEPKIASSFVPCVTSKMPYMVGLIKEVSKLNSENTGDKRFVIKL